MRHLIASVALALTGCVDPASGAGTTAKLRTMPNLHCVDSVLRAATGASLVRPMRVTRSAGQTIYSWDYGGDLNATLEIEKSGTSIRFLNSNVHMGRDTGQGARFSPIMTRVNAAVSTQCGVPLSDVKYG